jgi:hypothetical protein
MKNRTLAVFFVASMSTWVPAPAQARTATAAERVACEAKIQPKLEQIDRRLRAGYSAKEGESLRAQRRKLETQKASCRKIV